ncbi:MAG: glycoside hydrolase family 3 N-terminal domain-containing protein [Pseudomonadota bacterium]
MARSTLIRSKFQRAGRLSATGLTSILVLSAALTGCAGVETEAPAELTPATVDTATIHPEIWPVVETPPLDPEIEARIDDILSKLTVEQKVGQVIQGDSGSLTAEDVKQYRLGSVLSGGNSAPGPLPYADAQTWLDAADAYFAASIDPEGVEIAVPIIWGIDAVHGHANLTGAVVYPHNIGLGAANDPDLIEAIARATAHDLKVSGHDWTFAPTLAVPQNDRWGRTYEGFSESPDIVASYGDRIVYGLQGRVGEDGFLGVDTVISSAKHYVGDGGTENGIDQGDAKISEEELRDIHAAGYVTAVGAGAQTVMASFSAWQGTRMHGHKPLLTDVLKGQMNFNGFIVGDWNGHGLIPGCTNTDCPQALNAGLDMYMAPDSWRGLWHSTLAHVQSGEIPMERLDDAVRRILRVKLAYGVFEKDLPSQRAYAGDVESLGSDERRALAREAVRKSLVLLKNNDAALPADPSANILVVGDGANSIAKASGGWTLSWQGRDNPNESFPNGQTILDGIQDAVTASGGAVTFDPTGLEDSDADIVIAVYGEDPYAEFQGDVANVDFVPNAFDPATLTAHRARGATVISVFLSGRPLWTNPEINASDAFIAAWLPGSEGGGIADMLFRTNPDTEFTGRLSYSWPKLATQAELNVGDDDYDPLFPFGYGLTYTEDAALETLPEDSGLAPGATAQKGVFFSRGEAPDPWTLAAGPNRVDQLPFGSADLQISALNKDAQEDSLRIDFLSGAESFSLTSSYAHDFSRESNGAMELAFSAKVINGDGNVQVGMGCESDDATPCMATVPVTIGGDWSEVRVTLSCFAGRGVSMDSLQDALILNGEAGQSFGLSDVRIEQDADAIPNCGDA